MSSETASYPALVVPASLGHVSETTLATVQEVMHPSPPKRQRRDGVAVPRGVARRWTAEEETSLRMLVDDLGTGKWAHVAERLGSGRTASGVEQHWQIMTGQRKRNGKVMGTFRAPPVDVQGLQQGYTTPSVSTGLVSQQTGQPYHHPTYGAEVLVTQQQAPVVQQQQQQQYAQQYGQYQTALNHAVHHQQQLGGVGIGHTVHHNHPRYAPPPMYGQIPASHHMGPPVPPPHMVPVHRERHRSMTRHPSERGVPHRWTVDEEARLRGLVNDIGKGKWAVVAESLGTGRSASGVEQHWQIMIGQRKRNSSAKTPLKPSSSNNQGLPPAPAAALANSLVTDAQVLGVGLPPEDDQSSDDDAAAPVDVVPPATTEGDTGLFIPEGGTAFQEPTKDFRSDYNTDTVVLPDHDRRPAPDSLTNNFIF